MYSHKIKSVAQVVCVLMLVLGISAELPDYIDKCTAGDSKCILKNINNLLTTKFEGDESFGLPKLEPFQLGDIRLQQDAKNPVSIDLTLKKPVIYGIKGMRATRAKGFGKTPEGRHDILVEVPYLTLLSDYKIDGKVLILPIKGDGQSNLTLVQPRLKLSIDATARTENGQIYMDIKAFKVECIPKQLIMNFTNLFNGDKALGDNINKFINENWEEISNEMRKPMFDEISKQTKAIAQSIFNRVPYTELFDV